MSWDAGFAPYCGVWIDEGFLNRVSDMAFEPTTGYYDSLAAAWANGRCAVVAPSASVSWELRLQLGVPHGIAWQSASEETGPGSCGCSRGGE